jgi:hypothetical protein
MLKRSPNKYFPKKNVVKIMSNVLTDVKQQLLEPGGLTETDLQRVLNNLLTHSIDYTDL